VLGWQNTIEISKQHRLNIRYANLCRIQDRTAFIIEDIKFSSNGLLFQTLVKTHNIFNSSYHLLNDENEVKT
jgi:hypothetical protein